MRDFLYDVAPHGKGPQRSSLGPFRGWGVAFSGDDATRVNPLPSSAFLTSKTALDALPAAANLLYGLFHPKTGREFVKGARYPITYYGLGSNKRKWKKVGVTARIHDWRHTTGMRTLRKTRNLKLVQKLLGHKDIKITADFYTGADLDDIRDGMEETHGRPALPAKTVKRKKEE